MFLTTVVVICAAAIAWAVSEIKVGREMKQTYDQDVANLKTELEAVATTLAAANESHRVLALQFNELVVEVHNIAGHIVKHAPNGEVHGH